MTDNKFQPRIRGHVPQARFADQAKKAKAAAARTSFKRPDGLYDRLVLGDHPIWLRFSPEQLYAQLLYNREEKLVIETGTEDYPARPWFEHTTHFVPSRRRSFNCSAGPARDAACRGCAIRAKFYDRLREQEKSTSVRDEEQRKNPPIQASTRYAMAVTALEKIFEMPLLDKKGNPRKSRNGEELTHFVPAPLSGLPIIQQKNKEGVFGWNYHWSFGSTHLAQLAEIDQDLWNTCANCGSDLMAVAFNCSECEAIVYSDENGVTGSDLRAIREQAIKCESCNTEAPGVPVLRCTGCEDPAEGNLLAFDLRIKLVKIEDKKFDIKLEEIRMPDYIGLYDATTAERVTELVFSPLDIPTIFAPSTVDQQAWSLPEELKSVDAHYHLKQKESQPYGQEEETGDAEQMSFGDDAEG